MNYDIDFLEDFTLWEVDEQEVVDTWSMCSHFKNWYIATVI